MNDAVMASSGSSPENVFAVLEDGKYYIPIFNTSLIISDDYSARALQPDSLLLPPPRAV